MLRFYDAWAKTIIESEQWTRLGIYRRAERWNDQAAVHRIFLNRSSYAARTRHEGGGFALAVDADNLFSLQLWKCDGLTEHTKKPFEYCHEAPFEPVKGLRTASDGKEVTFTDPKGLVQKPFLVHSNGHHYVMTRDESGLRPLLDLYDAPPPELLRHPVVLVDSAEHGACNVTTIGWLMNATRSPEGAPWLRL